MKGRVNLFSLLQCGAFIFIPAGTFGIGLWLILKFIGMDKQISLFLLALLIGISFFEASAVGMLIDPRGGFKRISEIVITSGLIGLGVTLSVILIVPIYRAIIKIFK
jgi:hypothetical protein